VVGLGVVRDMFDELEISAVCVIPATIEVNWAPRCAGMAIRRQYRRGD
jgi:ketol-acid reductoisomerase